MQIAEKYLNAFGSKDIDNLSDLYSDDVTLRDWETTITGKDNLLKANKDFFDNSEMVFYKNISDLSEKILRISRDEKLRKSIAKKGKSKYMKYFNSTLVADFIVNKTLGRDIKKRFLWEK